MPSEAFTFKHVRNGKPIAASELPKLPPQATFVILNKVKELGLDPTAMSKSDELRVMSEVMVDLVLLSLRRMEPTLTRDDLLTDEDLDEVRGAFIAIQDRNETLFPKTPAPAAHVRPRESDPKGQPPAPA